MATSGSGPPSAKEPKEDQVGVSATVGGREKAMLAGRRLSRFKRVGWFSRQIRKIKAEA